MNLVYTGSGNQPIKVRSSSGCQEEVVHITYYLIFLGGDAWDYTSEGCLQSKCYIPEPQPFPRVPIALCGEPVSLK